MATEFLENKLSTAGAFESQKPSLLSKGELNLSCWFKTKYCYSHTHRNHPVNRWKVWGARVRAPWPWQHLRSISFVRSRWCQSDWFSWSGTSWLWDKRSSGDRPLSGFRSSQSLFKTQLMLLERAHLPPPSTGTWSCGTSQLGVLI